MMAISSGSSSRTSAGMALSPASLRGAVAALAGHDQVAVAVALDDDRLQDAVLRDRGGELGERVGIEVLPRLRRDWRAPPPTAAR